MNTVFIDDGRDPRVADYMGLTDGHHLRGGTFIAEGVLSIRQLIASAYPIRSLLVTPAKRDALAPDLDRLDVPVFVAGPAVISEVAGVTIHRGALAAVDRVPLPPLDGLLRTTNAVVVLEAVSDHENLGAVFRTARGLGFGAVLLCPRCCDPLYRRSVRVSLGHVLHVPHARLAPWPVALGQLKDAGFTLVALTPADDAVPLEEVVVRGAVAVLLGSEGEGLSPGALAAADVRAQIPMAADVDSLNINAAAAIALHHLRPRL